MVCVNVASEITLNLFCFFFLKHYQCPHAKPATPEILQHREKKESSSFYGGWRHSWKLGIYYFSIAKHFKGQTTIVMLNGSCVTLDCEYMWFLDHFVLTVQLRKRSVKMSENGACMLIYNWIKVWRKFDQTWSHYIILYNVCHGLLLNQDCSYTTWLKRFWSDQMQLGWNVWCFREERYHVHRLLPIAPKTRWKSHMQKQQT